MAEVQGVQKESLLIDQAGRPLRAKASAGSGGYQAADLRDQAMALWRPMLTSADGAYSFERPTLAARSHDLARNHSWVSSGLQKNLDNVIGGQLRLSAKPDYRALGLTAEWAQEWALEVEAYWRNVTEDPGFYIDAGRRLTINGLWALLYRHRLLDGECLAVLYWLPGRGGRASTAIQVIDPDRLSNPQNRMDEKYLRMGVELDDYGAPVAYHIRKAHPNEFFVQGVQVYEWERVARENAFGRPIVVHDFDQKRAGQTRGVSPLAPIVAKLKQYDRYDEAELGAAVVNALLAAFIESPMDSEMLAPALGATEGLSAYQQGRSEFHEGHVTAINGVQIPHLYPGEKFAMNAVSRPHTAYDGFVATSLRNFASALDLTYEQLSMDWSQTNYSSARAALLEVGKGFVARGQAFKSKTVTPIYGAIIEEGIEAGEISMPAGAPDFREARAAYTRAKWIGPPRGYIDPVKEAQGAQMRMDIGVSTLEDECAEQGRDYEEVLDQLEFEQDLKERRGLKKPGWVDQPIQNSQA